MGERIRGVRQQLVDPLRNQSAQARFRLCREAAAGMFLLFRADQRPGTRLREEFSVYAIDSGRICVAAINSKKRRLRDRRISKVSDDLRLFPGHDLH